MIPVHYFLALILILVSMMGCTQKAPPGTRNLETLGQSTDSIDPSVQDTRQQIKKRDDLVIRPKSRKGEGTRLVLEPFKGDRWMVQLEGDDAEMLFKLLEVESVDSDSRQDTTIKLGRDWSCIRITEKSGQDVDRSYGCSIVVFNLDGGIHSNFEKISGGVVLDADPELTLTSMHRSSYLELDPVSVGKFGRMVIYGNSARKLYESSSVIEESLKDLGMAHHRTGKRGKNMVCLQEFFQQDQSPSYSCRFYFNYNAGSFDEIQVMN